jgi:hypothetical protein
MPMLPNMRTTKRMSSNDMALIGVVLLALGIAVLAAGASLAETLVGTAGLWSCALAVFGVARRRGIRLVDIRETATMGADSPGPPTLILGRFAASVGPSDPVRTR